MKTNKPTQSRSLGQRLISHARALLAVSALAALAVATANAGVVFTRTTSTAEGWTLRTATFTPTYSGNYTLGFNLTAGGPSGDNSILIDAVKVMRGSSTVFSDGFQSPNLATNTGSNSTPGNTVTIGNWVFTNYSGILDGSPPNWGLDAQGLGSADGTTQYAYLQAAAGTLGKMKASNTLALFAGQTYTISFYQASRRDFGGVTTYTVTLDAPAPLDPTDINWVNWTGQVTTAGVTTYTGRMVVPRTGGGSTTVNVKYTPPNQLTDATSPSTPGIAFIQTSNGVDYWTQGRRGILGRDPATSPYTSAKVTNIPDGGGAASDLADIIALRYAGTNTLEFTNASTGLPIAIASPVFSYVSLNGNGYGFNQDFDILSFGDGTVNDQGYFGIGGTSSKTTALVGGATQYQLLGTGEPHGTLQFRGSFSTVNWQSLSNEYWNGFTVGVALLADDVPIANAGLDQTVTATSPSGASVQLTGSVSGSTETPFTYLWTGSFGTATGSSPTVALAVGTHTITLNVIDAAGASDTDTVVITVLANPAPVITSAGTASGTYGSAFSYTIVATNSPTSYSVLNLPGGLSLTGNVISGTPTETGSFGVNLFATNSGGTGTRSILITINKATATVVATPYSVTYDGQPHSATFTITGVNGQTGAAVGTVSHNTTHTNAGNYADSWSFTGNDNYLSIASTPIANSIAKATANVSVNGYTGTYDAAPHGATGSATGVGGVALPGLNLGASFTDAPGGTANWTFSGGTNYNDAVGTAAIVIAKATATVNVTGYTGIYDAAAHGATGSAIGVGGADLSAGLNLGATFTNVPGGTASWTFSGGTNYNDAVGTTTIAITKADATIVVTPYNVTYDSTAKTATGSATGVTGEQLSGLDLSATTRTNAGTTTDAWTFTDVTGNYNDARGSVTNTIDKAPSTTVVTITGAPFTYTGSAQTPATVAVTGIGGLSLTPAASYANNTNAGTATASYTYAGDDNHLGSSDSKTFTIDKAPSTTLVTITGGPFTYTGSAQTPATVAVTGIGGLSLTPAASYANNTNAGTATASYAYVGDANHTGSSDSKTFTIDKAPSTTVVTITGAPFTYTGSAQTPATVAVTGAGGLNLTPTASYANNTNAGTATASYAYTGDDNHTGSSDSKDFTIAKSPTKTTLGAVPTVQAVGQPVTLTATVVAVAPGGGVPNGTVTFNLGATVLGSATVNASGVATLTTTAIPLGPQSITSTYSGSSNYLTSTSNAVSILIYGYPTGGGTFVIGDGNATLNASVNFWGSQWEKNNSLSGGASNASFKGFATGPTPPPVGGTFTAAPGNSGPSPASVPAYLGVIVTSKVTKSGSNVTGTVVGLVVVKTNPGYAGSPGNPGTGTIVAVVR